MKMFFVTALLASVFVYLYFPVALPHGQPTTGYSMIPDAEADYLVTKSIADGGRLYEDFSILYPPGRFFLQALLFELISPSAIVSSTLRIALSLVLFPAVFLVLNQVIFKRVLARWEKTARYSGLFSLVLSFLSTLLYLVFIRSAQEIHVLIAMFFLTLFLPAKTIVLRSIASGLFFGLCLLFRLDAGIFLALALGTVWFLQPASDKKVLLSWGRPFLLGVGITWIPTLLAISLHGSLRNFLYDIVILGIIVQPKLMSLPIPPNELGLVFLSSLIFLTCATIAVFIDAKNIPQLPRRFALQSFALFALLSYVSALGRSDEPHLWYGLVWLSLFIVYALIRLFAAVVGRERPTLSALLTSTAVLFLFSWMSLKLKSPGLFLLGSVALTAMLYQKKVQVFSVLLAGTVLSITIFHSVSYLRLRYSLPKPPPRSAISWDWMTSEGSEVGGVRMQEPSQSVLDAIRSDIPASEEYLFIFPTNVLLGQYLGLKSPTRYIILGAERTDATEAEIIADLNRSKTRYFLIFDQKARDRNGKVWEWIATQTTIIREYRFPPDAEVAQLRMRNTTP